MSWPVEVWAALAGVAGMLLLATTLTTLRVLGALHGLRALADRSANAERAMQERLEQARLEAHDATGHLALLLERGLREMAEASAARLSAIEHTVGAQLHQAVEQQMAASFGRVLDQFAAVQKAMGEVAAVSAGIGDLKRIFSNVKTRGGWGETQLRALLDDLLPAGSYHANVTIGEGRVVEFAIRMPGAADSRPLLPIDAKLPLADYERLLLAAEGGDLEGERLARRALEQVLRTEGRRVASKYIAPPLTTDFAILYLPTDGLYAEAARIPGLVDELGRVHRVMLMGPGLLPGLLRTVHLGYVTLSLEQKAEQIGRLLGATRQEMVRMDEVLERLARNAGSLSRTIEDARTRTRIVRHKLRTLEEADQSDPPTASSPSPACGRGPG